MGKKKGFRPKKYPFGGLVAVEWLDAAGCPQGWVLCDESRPGLTEIQSVGWVMDETDDYLCIAPTISDGSKGQAPGVMGMITIPKACIVKRCSLNRALSF